MTAPPPAPEDVRSLLGLAPPQPTLAEPGPRSPAPYLAAAVDTMVAGIHFPAGTAPGDLGHKSLAVNLSDLAAMGAKPSGALLALRLPRPDAGWLAAFGEGYRALAAVHRVHTRGVEWTPGPLAVTVAVTGTVPAGAALTRAGARPGDRIWVTGHLGDAGMGLRLRAAAAAAGSRHRRHLVERLERPSPRIAAGIALRGLASAAIDVSDGFAADLGHVVRASGVGATVHVDRLPLSSALRDTAAPGEAVGLALSAGDDYELCFTAADGRDAEVARRLAGTGCSATPVGIVEARSGVRFVDGTGNEVRPGRGFDHFPAAVDRDNT